MAQATPGMHSKMLGQKKQWGYHSVMLVTQKSTGNLPDYLGFLARCIQGGITAVQLREKNLSRKSLRTFALQLKAFLAPRQVPLVINDHLQLACEINADGLHLGQQDGDIQKARNALGPDKILGLTVSAPHQLLRANTLPVDYVGIGPIFPTKHKTDAKNTWGCDALKNAVAGSRHPVVAIGGIDLNNAAAVLATQVAGIAAIGLFHEAPDPYLATKKLVHLVQAAQVCAQQV